MTKAVGELQHVVVSIDATRPLMPHWRLLSVAVHHDAAEMSWEFDGLKWFADKIPRACECCAPINTTHSKMPGYEYRLSG